MPRGQIRFLLAMVAAVVIAGGMGPVAAASEGSATGAPELGAVLPLWSVLPFVGILLSIALFPLLAPHFWHHHFAKVSAFWALLFALPFLLGHGRVAVHEILTVLIVDYLPFIVLLGSLYTVSGGILVRGSFAGTPPLNTLVLAVGTLLASWVGTTGAAMLLIRPLLRANARRRFRAHTVVFFIFLVANIGGTLTPLGDPPLFLGFLHGVPFFWTFRLLKETAIVAGLLLALYLALDLWLWRRESEAARRPPEGTPPRLRVEGLHNLLFLAGIVGGVLLSGVWHPGQVSILGIHQQVENLVRDSILVTMGLLSVLTTRTETRTDNEFSWSPILEVAYLFAGIFMTILPALAILKAGERGALAGLIRAAGEPYHYFWLTGGMSSFLDNAPTYLTFLNTALGRFFAGMPERQAVGALIANRETYLAAISLGAVYMGANTYIGNAPNFMVRSIAEESGVEMPSFFGYMLRYSIPILIPLFLLVTVLFF